MQRLILFDIDGTLAEGGPAKEAFCVAMEATFGTAGAIESHSFAGKTDPQIARELLVASGFVDAEIDSRFPALWDGYVEELEGRIATDGLIDRAEGRVEQRHAPFHAQMNGGVRAGLEIGNPGFQRGGVLDSDPVGPVEAEPLQLSVGHLQGVHQPLLGRHRGTTSAFCLAVQWCSCSWHLTISAGVGNTALHVQWNWSLMARATAGTWGTSSDSAPWAPRRTCRPGTSSAGQASFSPPSIVIPQQ